MAFMNITGIGASLPGNALEGARKAKGRIVPLVQGNDKGIRYHNSFTRLFISTIAVNINDKTVYLNKSDCKKFIKRHAPNEKPRQTAEIIKHLQKIFYSKKEESPAIIALAGKKNIHLNDFMDAKHLDKIFQNGTSLESIKLTNLPLSSLSEIRNPKQIASLVLENCPEKELVETLNRFNHLNTLNISGQFDASLFNCIGKKHTLENLALNANANNKVINDESIHPLAYCQNLKTLSLSKAFITAQGIQNLKYVNTLKSLRVETSNPIKGEAFKDCRFKETLRHLSLNDKSTHEVDAHLLKSIGELTRLKSLELEILPENGFEALQNLKNLKRIIIKGTHLTDDTLKDLQHFPRLTYFHITDGEEITIQGLENALIACPTLKTLQVNDLNVNQSELDQLQLKYPNVNII